MANGYGTWYSLTEQEWVTRCDMLLENAIGWYRIYTYTDTSTDRRYAWLSEGESDDGYLPRIIRSEAVSNGIFMTCPSAAPGSFNFTTGVVNTPTLGDLYSNTSFPLPIPGRSTVVANKDRMYMHFKYNTFYYDGYAGMIDSFYSIADDPNPVLLLIGATGSNWVGSNRSRMFRSDGAEVQYGLDWNYLSVDEGYPNPRNNTLSFSRGLLYYTLDPQHNEVRGRLKGIFYASDDKVSHGSFIVIDDEYHLLSKSNSGNSAVAVGPVSENKQLPVNNGWMPYPNLKVDYTYKGMQHETSTSGTLALWRFDTGHLEEYVYGSEATLPVPVTYPDTSAAFTLTAQNGVTSIRSRLREAADFNGTTHYTSSAGSAAATAALLNEWTVESVFMPTGIPTSTDRDTIVDYSSSGATASDNTLLRINISPVTGTSPDTYNVERGNLEVFWENGVGAGVTSTSTTDFIQENRWNYIAVTKKDNGGTFTIDVWHCSFGDFRVPTKVVSFTGLSNSTGGDNCAWSVGADEALADYFQGRIDDTRITKRVLSDEEIATSCHRSMI